MLHSLLALLFVAQIYDTRPNPPVDTVPVTPAGPNPTPYRGPSDLAPGFVRAEMIPG